MYLDGLHEKDIFPEDCLFRLEYNIIRDFYYPMHWHNAIEMVYISEGFCNVNVSGMKYCLSEREILMVPAGEIHDIHASGNGSRVFIQFDMSSSDVLKNTGSLKLLLAQTVKIANEDRLHDFIEEQIEKIIEEYGKKEFAYMLSLNARIYDILAATLRSQAQKIGNDIKNNFKKVFGLERINNALIFIEENYREDITLKDVSKAAGFSEYHFSRVFKEIMEKNFHYYINEFRVRKAEKLFMNNDITISQAAYEAGFNSVVTFNRIFKAIKGCTPSFYKKLLV